MNDNGHPSKTTPHIIKRYANRRFYDIEASRSVTLAGIANLVRSGTEIEVVDLTTGREITSLTLAQIICDEQRRSPTLSTARLCRIIREGLPRA